MKGPLSLHVFLERVGNKRGERGGGGTRVDRGATCLVLLGTLFQCIIKEKVKCQH